jgi:type I restriction enzyme S subunit
MNLNQYSNAAAQPGLSVARIKRLQIPIPPVHECLEIEQHLAASFDAIDMIRNNIFNQITTLTSYRKSLIHECVTGKRRITEGDLAKVGANV